MGNECNICERAEPNKLKEKNNNQTEQAPSQAHKVAAGQ